MPPFQKCWAAKQSCNMPYYCDHANELHLHTCYNMPMTDKLGGHELPREKHKSTTTLGLHTMLKVNLRKPSQSTERRSGWIRTMRMRTITSGLPTLTEGTRTSSYIQNDSQMNLQLAGVSPT
jgi:hypothetical protein